MAAGISDGRSPGVEGLLETALYVADLARARDFYVDLFGFAVLVDSDRLVALDVAPGQVLLLFLRGASTEPIRAAGGVIPPHDGAGRLHMAYRIAVDRTDAWERWLAAKGVALESRVTWPRGGTSLYFRDPDGHAIELATPGLWANW